MITWFEAPKEGLSPGGKIEFQTLTATENKTYSEDGVAYTSVTVNVEGGGGSSDFSTAEVTFNSRSKGNYNVVVPALDEEEGIFSAVTIYANDDPLVLYIPLYANGPTYLYTDSNLSISGDITSGGDTTLLGNIVNLYIITGDGTIS